MKPITDFLIAIDNRTSNAVTEAQKESHSLSSALAFLLCCLLIVLPLFILASYCYHRISQTELRKSEERFRATFEQAAVGIAHVSPEGQFLRINQKFCDIVGYSCEEMLKLTFQEITYPDDLDADIMYINQLLAGEINTYSMEKRYLRKNGEITWIYLTVSLVRNEVEEPQWFVSVVKNINERKQSELQIREMASFAELNPAPVLRVNPDGLIMSCNPASVEILGKNAKEGTSIASILPDLPKINLKKCIRDNMLLSQEIDIQERFYLFILRGVSDLKLLHIYGSDIADPKKTEEEVQQLRNEYTHIARVSVMGELTASLAHELKQPLAAMRSNAQAAQRFLTVDKPDIDELHEILEDIVKDNRRADDVIKKLRALMQKSELQITRLNINEVIGDILPLINSYEIARNISLKFELDKNISYVNGDRIQLQQVVLNLIINSSEALMDVEQQSSSIVVRTNQNGKDNVTVSVTDNGPGIDDTVMSSLFEPFYTTKTEGLGMGLAISRTIIDGHRGRFWAENNHDSGATFYFTIPIAKENQL